MSFFHQNEKRLVSISIADKISLLKIILHIKIKNQLTLIMSLESPITNYIDTSLNTIPIQTKIGEVGQKMVELGVDSILVLENE